MSSDEGSENPEILFDPSCGLAEQLVSDPCGDWRNKQSKVNRSVKATPLSHFIGNTEKVGFGSRCLV